MQITVIEYGGTEHHINCKSFEFRTNQVENWIRIKYKDGIKEIHGVATIKAGSGVIMSDLKMSASEVAESLCKTLSSVGVSVNQALKAVKLMMRYVPPLSEWDIILIQNNPSLSRRQKKKMIKEIRQAIEERERMKNEM